MNPEADLFQAVDTYFRALHACDVDLLDQVFSTTSSLFDNDEGKIFQEPYERWREAVRTRRSPASVGQEREDSILSIVWLNPLAATVHVRLRILDDVFADHLAFVYDGAAFRIVSKVWTLERRVDDAAS